MVDFLRIPCRLSLALVAAFCVLSLAPLAPAQGTHLWSQSQIDDFEKGTPQGVALTSDGHLLEGPGLKEVLTTPSTFVWSVTADKDGVAYVGTGSPATVLRVGANGKAFTLFESRDLSVQAVRLGPDGALYAATMPSGRVYKLKPDAGTKQDESNAMVVFDPAKLDGGGAEKTGAKSRYVWDLTFDTAGRLYIATGDPGAVYRLDVTKSGAQPELFFKSDEAHVRALAWDAKGNLVAGTDGSGLVYRIDAHGKGYVLFEAPRREITSLAVATNGTIYAACVGDKSHNPLPPLPVQGVSTLTITIVQPASVQAVNQSSAVPEGTEVYALAENQAPRKLWASKDDIIYALVNRPDGLLAFTGNRGRIYRIQSDGSYADIGHLDAQQALSVTPVPASGSASGEQFLIGTGNTGKVVRMGVSEQHEYASDVLDTGAMARFGRVEIEPGSVDYEVLTRSGNVEQPARGRGDWGWSDWEPLKEGSVASPAGRYLQWKVLLHAGGTLGSVGVNYLPVNAAPIVDEVVVVPGARLNPQGAVGQPQTVSISLPSSGQSVVSYDGNSNTTPLQATKDRAAITVRWGAHDDNGDDLIYALYLRGDGETVWRMLKDKLREQAYSFDATLVPDGGYQVKVVASDAPSHTPGQALTGDKVSDRFVVDTTPPAVVDLKASHMITCGGAPCGKGVVFQFDARDGTSPIAHAEYSLDAGPWQYIEPVGEISDSKTEHYSVEIPTADWKSEHLITVRAYDRYDNVGVAKTVIAAEEK